MEVKRISLTDILLTIKNPRQDAADDPDLTGLAASMGDEGAPVLAQPPVLEALGDGKYRTISGERRIRAARLAEWQTIECLIRPPLEPLTAHRLRVVENLHRKALHPLDQAVALKLAWHSTNAVAMGLSKQVEGILDKEQIPTKALTELESLLTQNGFTPNHPLVSWDEMLDGLGLAFDRERRKKLLQVLGVAPEVQEQLRHMDITEASLRALAKLEPEDQARLVEEVAENPDLGRKIRRISNAVRAHDYALEEALAEAKGVFVGENATSNGSAPHLEESEDEESEAGTPAISYVADEDLADQVVQFMDAAHTLKSALENLHEAAGERAISDFPEPWGKYALDTLADLRAALDPFQE